MFSFVRRRMYTSALPLIIVLLGVFLLARLTGDPTSLYLPESATAEQREAFAAKNGFDQPMLTQLVDYFKGVIHLDFGTSLRTGESASAMALRAFPATLQLAATTMLLAIIGAVVIGCWAAYRPNSLADRFSSLLSMTAASIPDFWFAITGVWLFAVLLGVLPTSGVESPLSWILPIATLMIRPLGVLTQVVRGAMVSALSAPYVRLARSKGASDFRVVTHHALRNAAAPGPDRRRRSGGRIDQRRGGGRGHIRLAGHRQADDRRDPAARLRGPAGGGAADRRGHLRPQHHHRRLLRAARRPRAGTGSGLTDLKEFTDMSTQLDFVPEKPTTAVVGDADTATARRQGLSLWFRMLINDRVAAVAAAVLGLVFLTAIFGPMLVGNLATQIDLDNSNQAPFTLAHGWANVLGTDPLGRSMLARLIVACRTTLSVAIPAVVISAVVGSIIGMWAGFHRGWRETVAMRVADVIMSFPSLLLAVVVLYVFSPSAANIVLVLAITRIPVYLRTARAESAELQSRLFVDAARTFGASATAIITRHVVPIVLPTLLTVATLDFCYVMLAESSLSFLGIGIQPPDVSWGLMVSQGRTYLHTAWWLSFFPGLAIVITTVSATILAAWARIATDPGQRWRLTVPQKTSVPLHQSRKAPLRTS